MQKENSLTPIKFTKNQTLILQVFFNNPEKSYYLRELGRIIGKQPGIFQKDINTLANKGILISEYQANSRFFKINKSYPLYFEFKSIFFKTVGIKAQLEKVFKKIKNTKIAFIFGSFASGKEDTYSDVDLMLMGNPDEDILISKISSIEKKIGREINYNIFSVEDFKKGLKGNEVFLEEILENPKIFIVGNENELEKIIGK